MANRFMFIIVSLMIFGMPDVGDMQNGRYGYYPKEGVCLCLVQLKNDGPVVYAGSNITFTAEVLGDYRNTRIIPDKSAIPCVRSLTNFCTYKWKDNYEPPHQEWSVRPNWTVSYPADAFKPGMYTVEVFVNYGRLGKCRAENNFELKKTNILIMI